uniref:Uncharacterized protein n=1 Tax=Zea mays TaxID=4577 RepID=C0P339_MAIZE|nr:unknown [Zea mays]
MSRFRVSAISSSLDMIAAVDSLEENRASDLCSSSNILDRSSPLDREMMSKAFMLEGLTATVGGEDTVTFDRFLFLVFSSSSASASASASSRWWWRHLQAFSLPSTSEVSHKSRGLSVVRGQSPFWNHGFAVTFEMVILVLGLGSSSLARSLRASTENHGGHL